MAERIPQSVTIRVPLQAYLSSDHITPATGKTIAITISKNGASYGNPSGGATNATEIGSGSYYVDLSTTDSGTLGPLFVKGTEGTIDNVIAIYNVITYNDVADAVLKRDWTAVSGEAARSTLNALRKLRNKIDTTTNAGFLTVFKENDITQAYTQVIVVDAAAELITSAG